MSSQLEKICKFDRNNFDESLSSWNNNNDESIDSREKIDNFVETSPDRTINSTRKDLATFRKRSNANWRERLHDTLKNGRKIFSRIQHHGSSVSDKKNVSKIGASSSSCLATLTPLGKTIDEIDDRIDDLEMRSANRMTTQAVVEMCNRVYTVLGDIKCESTNFKGSLTSIVVSSELKNRDTNEKQKSRHDKTYVKDESIDRSIRMNPGQLKSSTDDTSTEYMNGKQSAEIFDGITDNGNFEWPVRELSFEDESAHDPSKNFSTLDRSMRIYRSLSQRIKSKFQSRPMTREPETQPIALSSMRDTDRVQELLREAKTQQIIMNQATKAVNFCNAAKEFTDSSERIESERLMLLADLRKKAVMREIRRITSSRDNHEKDSTILSLGVTAEITIDEINLNLRKYLRNDFQEGETMEWFVIVVTHGLKVWATRAICCPIKNSRIPFSETISIKNLCSDFTINVAIYSLKLRKLTYNHEDKYRIKKHAKSTSCLPYADIIESPKKVLKKFERASSSEIRCDAAIYTKIRDTSFDLVGFAQFILNDLSSGSPWQLIMVRDDTMLKETMDLNITCRLDLSINHEGFVNHGRIKSDHFVSWNRYWCVLRGHNLLFWNYPREQDNKEPTMIIELRDCVEDKIDVVDRTICAKPRTLIIKTARSTNDNDRNIIRNGRQRERKIFNDLLYYDTVREMNEWSIKFNHVISILREWRIIDLE